MAIILVVDDEPNIRKFISLNLTIRKYHVIEADSGEAALEILRGDEGSEISAILLDISLPGINGWQLLSRIQEEMPGLMNIPVVVISGSMPLNESSRKDFRNVLDVLDKPIGTQQLLQVVQRAVDARVFGW